MTGENIERVQWNSNNNYYNDLKNYLFIEYLSYGRNLFINMIYLYIYTHVCMCMCVYVCKHANTSIYQFHWRWYEVTMIGSDYSFCDSLVIEKTVCLFGLWKVSNKLEKRVRRKKQQKQSLIKGVYSISEHSVSITIRT